LALFGIIRILIVTVECRVTFIDTVCMSVNARHNIPNYQSEIFSAKYLLIIQNSTYVPFWNAS